MADTPRTLAALQALLADNTSGDISPQDVRDFLVSCGLITGTGELGGTADAPTVTTTHSGSSHAATQAAAEAAAAAADAAHVAAGDPHTGYRLESADHTHASSGIQGGTVAHSALTSVTANQHHNQIHTQQSHAGSGTWKMLYTDSFGDSIEFALGADGTFLQANGTGAPPTFAALVAGDIPARTATILCGAGGLQPNTTNGATDTGRVELASGYDAYFLDFPDSAKKYAYVWIPKMPSGYAAGTLAVQFIWYSTVGDNTKDVLWGVDAMCVGDGVTPASGIGSEATVSDASSGTANRLQISGVATCTVANAAADAPMYLRINRDPTAGGDDFGATARLFGIAIEFSSSYSD